MNFIESLKKAKTFGKFVLVFEFNILLTGLNKNFGYQNPNQSTNWLPEKVLLSVSVVPSRYFLKRRAASCRECRKCKICRNKTFKTFTRESPTSTIPAVWVRDTQQKFGIAVLWHQLKAHRFTFSHKISNDKRCLVPLDSRFNLLESQTLYQRDSPQSRALTEDLTGDLTVLSKWIEAGAISASSGPAFCDSIAGQVGTFSQLV